MASTLKQIRQELGKDLDECYVGTVASATATALVDSTLIDAGESESKWEQAYLYLGSAAAADQERRVSAFAPATGTLTVSRAWSVAPTAAWEYELHQRLKVSDLNRLINKGLQRCSYQVEQTMSPVASQRNYSLAAYTWLLYPEQVYNVLWRQGDPTKYRYLPVEWYRVRSDAGALTLDVYPYSISTGDTLVVQAVRWYDALASDAATTACPLAWAKSAAALEIYQWLTRNGPAQDVARYEAAQAKAAADFSGQCMRYAPRPARRVSRGESPYRGTDSSIVS